MKRIKLDLNIGFESLDISARDTVTGKYLGNYKSVFKGRGLEFSSYRNYSPDDDASMIDWKASARADELMVKEYVEERNMEVFFLIDVSGTMIFSSQPKLKCEYAAELISALSYSILKSGDKVGFALFNEEIVEYIPPRKGIHPILIDTLSKADNYGGGLNFKSALDFTLETLKKGTLIIIVSDFIGISTGWEESIKLMGSKFSLIGIMVRDPIDRKIPEGMGQIAISDPLSKESMLIDPDYIKPYFEEEVRKMEEHIDSVFMDNNADFTVLQTDDNFIGKIIELFKMRSAK